MLFIFYFGKKARASSIRKQFVFPESNDPPKVATPKAANSESNEGRYYRNSTVGNRVRVGAKINHILIYRHYIIFRFNLSKIVANTINNWGKNKRKKLSLAQKLLQIKVYR